FQRTPYTETKLVSCMAGRILDVFVDLRKNSSTFGKWGFVELDDISRTMVLVPRGFAHGYLTLTKRCVVSYKVDSVYTPSAEGGLQWNDSAVGIAWPTKTPILSEKDSSLPLLKEIEPL